MNVCVKMFLTVLLWITACCLSVILIHELTYIPKVTHAKAVWMNQKKLWDVIVEPKSRKQMLEICHCPNVTIKSVNDFVLFCGPYGKECAKKCISLGYENVFYCNDYLYL